MSADLFSLKGKVVVITGATKGIGEGMATGLAEAGAELIVVHRAGTDPSRAVKKYESLGATVCTVVADMESNAEVDEILPLALKLSSTGTVDVLINNAGITNRAAITETQDDDWDRVIQVNLTTPFRLSRAFAKYWIDNKKKGKIINTASLYSFVGGVGVCPYTASKGALHQLTKTCSNEWSKYGITVNSVVPGFIHTDMTENGIIKNPERSGQLLSRIPAGRWGSIDDFRGPTVFLSSAASDYMTGGSIAVDGGFLGF